MGISLSRIPQYILADRTRELITGNTAITGNAIPISGTVQITEGSEVFNFNYTPKYPGSLIIFTSVLHFATTSGGSDAVGAALFLNGVTDAVAVTTKRAPVLAQSQDMIIRYEFNSVSTSAINFQYRIGTSGGANLAINHETGNDYGGTLYSWAVVEEWLTPEVFD